jgi:adenine-specific DNA-methyltransferase
LFTVFGEPDVTVREEGDELVVELRGVDVYDPTTGEVRSDSTDDIACWFIDTEYDQESFFVRHAYFTGGDKPYERLQKTLRADIERTHGPRSIRPSAAPSPSPTPGELRSK